MNISEGIFWWRKEGNIAWAGFWCCKFKWRCLGAWDLNYSHALGKVTTQLYSPSDPERKSRDKRKEKTKEKRRAKRSGYIFKSDLCALKFPLVMLDRLLWGASTCRSRWETHLYFLKSRKGMERGRSIADRTCILNVTVRWLNRPLWGHCNSRLHTVPALTGSTHLDTSYCSLETPNYEDRESTNRKGHHLHSIREEMREWKTSLLHFFSRSTWQFLGSVPRLSDCPGP